MKSSARGVTAQQQQSWASRRVARLKGQRKRRMIGRGGYSAGEGTRMSISQLKKGNWAEPIMTVGSWV